MQLSNKPQFTRFTPMEYLQIDVANSFGHDKLDWADRISWFHNHQAELLNLLDLIEAGKSTKGTLLAQAKEPALFYAGLKAWSQASKGLPISYPISLDATASGPQIMALLLGCRKSALTTNVISTGHREDFYTNMHRGMQNRMPDAGKITRQDAKDAIMPWCYGSEAEPKATFGEGAQLSILKTTMAEDAPGITKLRDALVDLWLPDTLSHDWTLPDDFHVKVKVMDQNVAYVQFVNQPYEVITEVNRPVSKGLSNAANIIHSIDGFLVREILRRCAYDVARLQTLMELLTNDKPLYAPALLRAKDTLVQTLWDHYIVSGFLSTRILELLDEENLFLVDRDLIVTLIGTLPDKPFPVLTVHDCFRVHPDYANDLRAQYNQVLHDLAKSDMLAFICNQITGYNEVIPKYDHIAGDVLNAEYALS